MYNYIIIRVKENYDPDKVNNPATAAGLIRKALHGVADYHEIEVADNLIRFDRKFLWDGQPNPYADAEELFRKIMPRDKNC